ncbi:MAG: PDZ domain-containing protein [Pyrinomonadaceae bacterium]|nr:PDZ domain-containing protein [Pyrinomonadaceae bacterium]
MQGARRGFSVSLGTIPSYADGNNNGLVLDGVRNNSPASKAGIKPGDRIVRLAGKEIRNISDYVFILGEMKADQEYEVIVMRGKQRLSLKIIPKKR